jgi:SAM-dependent methyltransferase
MIATNGTEMHAHKALERARRQWTTLGKEDPLWAVLTEPGKRRGGWDHRAFFETGAAEIDKAVITARRFAEMRFGTAVDFGCGVGRLSQALAGYFEAVIGVDISSPMILAAGRLNRFPERCSYVHNVAPDLAVLASASADLVYSSITLQHVVPDLARGYIREFFRVARSGGHVIFQLPSRPRSSVWHWVKKAAPVAFTNLLWRIRTGSPEAIETYFTPEASVKELVQQSGGTVAFVESDRNGPPGWESRQYFCVRASN